MAALALWPKRRRRNGGASVRARGARRPRVRPSRAHGAARRARGYVYPPPTAGRNKEKDQDVEHEVQEDLSAPPLILSPNRPYPPPRGPRGESRSPRRGGREESF